MDVILTLLLVTVGVFSYLLNSNKNEVLRLKQELRNKDHLIDDLRRQLAAKPKPQPLPPPVVTPPIVALPTNQTVVDTTPKLTKAKKFVSVIFNEGDEKSYDYFLGKHRNVHVGDFVEVYATDKTDGKPKWAIAQVVYVSKRGESSKYAKSTIVKKADYPKW